MVNSVAEEDFVGMWLGGLGEVCWGVPDLLGALYGGLVLGLGGIEYAAGSGLW